jgi:hypothetical protein
MDPSTRISQPGIAMKNQSSSPFNRHCAAPRNRVIAQRR